MILLGRQTKSFPLRSKSLRRGKQPKVSGIDRRLQQLRFSSVKDNKLDKERSNMPMGSGLLLLGIKGKVRSLFDDIDDSPSHPRRDSTLRFFKRTKDEGSSVIAVPPTYSSSKLLTFPKFSGRLLRHLQPRRSN